jgi:hypothetical protein
VRLREFTAENGDSQSNPPKDLLCEFRDLRGERLEPEGF